MRRETVGLIGGLAGIALLASCGGTTPVAVSANSPVTLTAAVTRTEASSTFRFSFTQSLIAGLATLTAQGAVDLVHQTSETTITPTGGGPSATLIVIGPDAWMAERGPQGKWLHERGSTNQALSADQNVNPLTFLDKLKALGGRTNYVGPAMVAGVRTSHLHLAVDQAVPVNGQPSLARSRSVLDLWVDAAGRLRKLVEVVTSKGSPSGTELNWGSVTATFADFGLPVNIHPPNQSQVVELGG